VIQVTLRGMRTTDLIGAGFSWNPQHLTVPYTAGLAPGTWTAISQLQPGDSYKITTYSPRPSAAQLRSAGKTYDALDLQGDLTVGLERVGFGTEQVVFPPFGQGGIPQNISDLMTVTGLEAIRSSPYAGVYALARRLARHAGTQYGFIQRVLAYLSRGYAYDERPPPSRYPPLVAFLMHDKLGYCQQFAGAMALLLRMGGVPARVSTGFTTGTYNSSRHVWVVSDQDAHAWVEAWFPHYGWVRFDPTPAAAPALGGKSLLPPLHGTASAITPHLPVRKAEPTPASSASKITVHPGSNSSVPVIVGAALIVAVLVLTLRTVVRLNEPDGNELLAELERALSRSGRPVSSGVTLVALEHRFRDTPAAAAYVRAIRMLRFGGSNELPTTAQRRALRGQLRYGLGAFGRLRALWALPPRWTPSRDAADRGLHSD